MNTVSTGVIKTHSKVRVVTSGRQQQQHNNSSSSRTAEERTIRKDSRQAGALVHRALRGCAHEMVVVQSHRVTRDSSSTSVVLSCVRKVISRGNDDVGSNIATASLALSR